MGIFSKIKLCAGALGTVAKKYGFACVVAVSVSACSTAIISSGKTSDFDQTASAVNIVFVEADLGNRDGFRSGFVENKANQQRLDLGVQIANKMPAIFSAKGIRSQAKSLAPASVPSDATGYRALFAAPPNVPVLLINPVSAMTTCPNDCFQYRMQVKLVSTITGKVVWTSTIDLPPKASRFHDFGGVATDFSDALLVQLQKDGVIKQP